MLATGLEYWVRFLWTGSGLCAVTLSAAPETDWAVRLVMLLCGVSTLLLSILLGAFVKHIMGHEAYSQRLYTELDRRSERLFKALHGTVNDAQCKSVQKATATTWSGQMDLVRQRLDTLEHRIEKMAAGRTPAPKYREIQSQNDTPYFP